MPIAAFRAWRARHGLTVTAAAEALGLGHRMTTFYDIGTWPVPKPVISTPTAMRGKPKPSCIRLLQFNSTWQLSVEPAYSPGEAAIVIAVNHSATASALAFTPAVCKILSI